MRPSRHIVTGSLLAAAARPAPPPPSSYYYTCARCQTRAAAAAAPRRDFSSTTPRASPSAPSAPLPTSGLVALSSRRLLSISGPDAPKFLQGVITQNILAPGGGSSNKIREDGFYGAFLTATGRVLYDVFVYPVSGAGTAAIASTATAAAAAAATSPAPGESFLLEVDAAEAVRLERHIKRYKLRARFAVRLLDEGEATVWHAWRDGSSSSSSSGLSLQGADPGLLAHITDPRAPGLGWRIVRSGDAGAVAAGGFGDEAPSRIEDEDVYRARRYLLGVPEGQGELLRETALPLEGNLDAMGAIDFRKGCYVGQELTIRTKHRGVVRKRVLPVMLYDDDAGASGAPEKLEYRPGPLASGVDAASIPTDTSIGRAGRKGRSAGKWLRGVGNVGLGLCRLETMTDVVLPGETAAGGFDPAADEFVMEQPPGEDGAAGGFRVKVKAFVPDWLRRALKEQSGGHHQ